MMQSIGAIRSGVAARRGLAALPNADYCEHALGTTLGTLRLT